jgi:hypothetical protein
MMPTTAAPLPNFRVPDDLTERDQWVLWRYEERNGQSNFRASLHLSIVSSSSSSAILPFILPSEIRRKRSLFLFQCPVILADKTADLLGHPQEFFPLLAIERNREASEPVNGEPALLTDFHGNLAASGLLERLILSAKPLNLCLQFFFRCHESVIAQQGWWPNKARRCATGGLGRAAGDARGRPPSGSLPAVARATERKSSDVTARSPHSHQQSPAAEMRRWS